jgi:hypothetical protein
MLRHLEKDTSLLPRSKSPTKIQTVTPRIYSTQSPKLPSIERNVKLTYLLLNPFSLP